MKDGMSSAEQIHGVIAGYDGSETGDRALEWAAEEAKARATPLTVVHVWDVNYGTSMGLPPVDMEGYARETLTTGKERVLAEVPGLQVNTVLERGSAAARLIEASRRADLLVVGARGRGGFAGLVLGSVGAQLAAHASCPVVVVRGDGVTAPEAESGHVVVGVDGSRHSRAALDLAFSDADLHGVPLLVVVAWNPAPGVELPPLVDEDGLREAARTRLERILVPLRERYPQVDARTRLEAGAPREVLLNASSGARLLVVGSRGLGGIRGLMLGSVSHALVHHASCPVAVTHASARAAATDET
jgi:nucleotide-binding universal stress UspA family protein